MLGQWSSPLKYLVLVKKCFTGFFWCYLPKKKCFKYFLGFVYLHENGFIASNWCELTNLK